jgi:hypothetical protein
MNLPLHAGVFFALAPLQTFDKIAVLVRKRAKAIMTGNKLHGLDFTQLCRCNAAAIGG